MKRLVDVRTACESYRATGEDRVAVIDHPAGCVIVVADGVGGRSNGAAAAEALVCTVRDAAGAVTDVCDADGWCEVLADADRSFANAKNAGETTAVVVGINCDHAAGASIGDSGAWVITSNDYRDLTRDQQRKPFLGSGMALPIAFRWPLGAHDTLLVATDGLLKYTSPAEICRVARSVEFDAMPKALIALVRLGSGALQDDVGITVARRAIG